MEYDEIMQQIEACQMIQQRNPPRSELWLEASDNLAILIPQLLACDVSRRKGRYEVQNLDTGESHGTFDTLDEAQGCVRFDRIEHYVIWLGERGTAGESRR